MPAGELRELNRGLGIWTAAKLPPFVRATEEQLEDYPVRAGSDLWTTLGFVVLIRLASLACAHRLPVLLHLDRIAG